jgi:hypothetical protein
MPAVASDTPDIRVENHGTLYLLWPLSADAEKWLRDHTTKDAQWWGPGRSGLTRGGLVVEPRYVADIVAGARDAGLRVA